jgi:hypothetical protein
LFAEHENFHPVCKKESRRSSQVAWRGTPDIFGRVPPCTRPATTPLGRSFDGSESSHALHAVSAGQHQHARTAKLSRSRVVGVVVAVLGRVEHVGVAATQRAARGDPFPSQWYEDTLFTAVGIDRAAFG